MPKTFIVRRFLFLSIAASLAYILWVSAASKVLPVEPVLHTSPNPIPEIVGEVDKKGITNQQESVDAAGVSGEERLADNDSTASYEKLSKPEPPFRKPQRNDDTPPVEENFPIAATARSNSDLPGLPAWNKKPPSNLVTPLFIGFTRNWPMLQQTVVSYLASGWPADQIYVVENTGTMAANARGNLTLQNPFFLDFPRLEDIFGVNIISTPTLLTFAQLQNFFLYTSIQREWRYYFWSHMDVVVVSDETREPFESVYYRILEVLQKAVSEPSSNWAAYHFSYDHLTLVNATAYEDIGGFDPMISFYQGDCDFHERLKMANYSLETAEVGRIFDVGMSLPDLSLLYHTDDPRTLELCFDSRNESKLAYGLNDCRYDMLVKLLEMMEFNKMNHDGGRNFWQGSQRGGKGEPFYIDHEGFEWSIRQTIEHGKTVYREKWGTERCDLVDKHLTLEDAWNVYHEWDYVPPEVNE